MTSLWRVPAGAGLAALSLATGGLLAAPTLAGPPAWAAPGPVLATGSPAPSPTPSPSPTPARSSWVQVMNLPSHDAGRSSRTVLVYRPAVPDSATLPVLYLLHGQYGRPQDPFGSGMRSILDRLFAQGWPPFVVAVPDGGSAARTDDEWGNAADHADSLETFVTHDVLVAVEGSMRRDRAHRAVAGFSMGGYAAAFNAGLRPSLYGQMVSLAGYFRVDDPEGVWGGSSVTQDQHYPLRHPHWLDHTRVLLLDTAQDNDPVTAGQLQAFQRTLAGAGHAPGARVTDGGHDWSWVSAQWPLIVRFLTQGWGH
ncbi:MAG: esterase family protein [Actinomycetota bacterium]|nr:esterase family protein [Actinomycetota bacterium]